MFNIGKTSLKLNLMKNKEILIDYKLMGLMVKQTISIAVRKWDDRVLDSIYKV